MPLSQNPPLRPHDRRSDDECDEYWPDVSSRYAVGHSQTMKQVSLRSVLFEAFLIFAGAGTLVLAVSVFVP